MFYMSASHLCRRFKTETGVGLHRFIVDKRIALAKSLLANGDAVTATAQKCGFNDLSNFIRRFKKHVGMAPNEYKKNPDLLRLQTLTVKSK